MIDKEPFIGWKIKEKIGEGAFGTVYRAEKEGFNSAIKQIIIPNNTEYIDVSLRFQQNREKILSYYKPKVDKMRKEIEIMRSLSGIHGIVIYHDHFIKEYDERGGWEILIRMEYLKPLEYHIYEKGITIRQIIKMGSELSKALQACYKKNIIHRDIKLNNILIDKHGNFKLCDFGVAKNLEGMSHAVTMIGTLNYMAPEVKNNEKYDYRADMYSLGVVIYKLLNKNMLPFTIEENSAVDNEKAISKMLCGVKFPAPFFGNDDIIRCVLKACEYDKEQRFRSFEEMDNDLNKLLIVTNKELLDKYVIECNNLDKNDNLKKDGNFINDNFSENSSMDNELKNDQIRTILAPIDKLNNGQTITVGQYIAREKENLQEKEKIKLDNIVDKNLNLTDNKNNFDDPQKDPKGKFSKVNKISKNPIFIFYLILAIVIPIFIINMIKNNDNSDIVKQNKIQRTKKPEIKKKTKLDVADFVQFGKYYNRSILWRCAKKDKNSVLLVSEYILTLKAFDAAESGVHDNGATDIEKSGSNRWDNSNIREWLNSTNKTVKYTSQAPTKEAVWQGYNAYANEAGFLTNFNNEELNKIQEYYHDSVIDKVFLLSSDELKSIWPAPKDRRKVLSKSAVKNSEYIDDDIKVNKKYWYWVRPVGIKLSNNVTMVDDLGGFDDYYAHVGFYGILPAIYLNTDKCQSGEGTKNNPYKIIRKINNLN